MRPWHSKADWLVSRCVDKMVASSIGVSGGVTKVERVNAQAQTQAESNDTL